MTRSGVSELLWGLAITVAAFAAYSANGREIPSFDSQPNKFAARELLTRGTLSLNHVVGQTPLLAERPAFVRGHDGRYRSAYSPIPAVIDSVATWPLWKLHIIDVRAPLAAELTAKITASLLTAISVLLSYRTARQRVSRPRALLLATGLGLGTGLWSAVSQTLWVHETAILGLMIAMTAFSPPQPRITVASALTVGIGLSLAGAARPQLAPAIGVLLVGLFFRTSWKAAAGACAIVGISAAGVMLLNVHWFGAPLGAMSMLEAASPTFHATTGSFLLPFDGLLGLLISPNRGLLIFSPVVIATIYGIRSAVVEGWRTPLRWCGLAAFAQYLFYGSYSVWWAGHTYGPRYLLDVLPLLVPLAAASLVEIERHRVFRVVLAGALAWSILVGATGAFCYPHDEWNTSPESVDLHHERLWSWSDMQIVRCWERGPSPQNFSLFARDAVRVPAPQP